MKKSLLLNADELTTLWLLSMLHTAILTEGMTQDYAEDLQRYNAELKAIVKKAGLGSFPHDTLLIVSNL